MYKTIVFDLDDTLTNDRENIKEAFKIILQERKEEYTKKKFERFYRIDKKTWKDRAAGKLLTPYEDAAKEKKAEWLRASRFLAYFHNAISYEEAVKINDSYMEAMKQKIVARQGTLNIIQYLYDKHYNLVIATNGPIIPLETKIEKLQITPYLKTVFSAEEVGYMKPHIGFYKGLLEKIGNPPKENILFIGDELEKDIKGGIENHLDTCWVNYNKEKTSTYIPKYEIHHLEELREIL